MVSLTRRSSTRHHDLLPASRAGSHAVLSTTYEATPRVPTYTLLTWTFGRGSVIWRIWPAVLLHTIFAAGVVTVSMRGIANLDIPNVMLTVIGVVIGFVISYRASSGYDRYWLGRTCWSDIIRTSRTMGRLVWFHVPPRLTPKTTQEIEAGKLERTEEEMLMVMNEKRIALDLVEGFSVALKHHIRGELGIYYEDLYHLIQPLHPAHQDHNSDGFEATTTALASPQRPQRISSQPPPQPMPPPSPPPVPSPGPAPSLTPIQDTTTLADPSIPSIPAYGTFESHPTPHQQPLSLRRSSSQASSLSSLSSYSASSYRPLPLLPSTIPADDTVLGKVSNELIPFSGLVDMLRNYLRPLPLQVYPPNVAEPIHEEPLPVLRHRHHHSQHQHPHHQRNWKGPVWTGAGAGDIISSNFKHRPKVAGDGQNLPLEILRFLSEWLSVLEDRNTVPGMSMGPMITAIATFEESLTALERILTTPLPFVYSVHISTVWIYLFFLPFQLVDQFGYYTIPGVAIAAFIYLGFLAAGEEIEQPFGYDDNDLDLDLFCKEIIHADMAHLKTSPCLNAYFASSPEHPKRTFHDHCNTRLHGHDHTPSRT